ncbi:MAG: endolytic transglycosylase MltG [Pseudomonadota bacterium]
MTSLISRVLAVAVIALLGLGGVAAWGANAVWRWLESPLPIPADAVLEVEPGTSLTHLAQQLAERGWLTHPRWLSLLARWQGDATRIQAGQYRLDQSLTPSGLLALLVSGEVIQYQVTLIEGWTVREAVRAIREHPHVRVTSATSSPAAIVQALEYRADCAPDGCTWATLEGQLFPDTYQFPEGSEDIALLKRAHARLREALMAHWEARDTALPLENASDLLVLASIVEKETGLAEEREKIAGVFVRRLRRSMRLQSDPTVIYGLGDAYAGDITRAHLRTDTPYNTYTRSGLPPTPIAMAGRAALQAAAHPAVGDALYFVATGVGDGSHQFSATLEEHNAAVRRYLQRQRQQQHGRANE